MKHFMFYFSNLARNSWAVNKYRTIKPRNEYNLNENQQVVQLPSIVKCVHELKTDVLQSIWKLKSSGIGNAETSKLV